MNILANEFSFSMKSFVIFLAYNSYPKHQTNALDSRRCHFSVAKHKNRSDSSPFAKVTAVQLRHFSSGLSTNGVDAKINCSRPRVPVSIKLLVFSVHTKGTAIAAIIGEAPVWVWESLKWNKYYVTRQAIPSRVTLRIACIGRQLGLRR